MENKKEDALYMALTELNQNIALKYKVPQETACDNTFKERMNRFYELLGIKTLPYPEILDNENR